MLIELHKGYLAMRLASLNTMEALQSNTNLQTLITNDFYNDLALIICKLQDLQDTNLKILRFPLINTLFMEGEREGGRKAGNGEREEGRD